MDHEILEGTAELSFIGPEIEIALGYVVLRVGKQRFVVRIDDATECDRCARVRTPRRRCPPA